MHIGLPEIRFRTRPSLLKDQPVRPETRCVLRPDGETCAIAVMAKAPRAGRSKTRLCPPLRPEEAAALSGAFLQDITRTMAAAAGIAPIAPYAAYAPAADRDVVADHVPPGTGLILADGSPPPRPGVEGFGRCLLQAIDAMLERGHPAACVLSSDVPTLPARLLVEAARHLLAPGDRAVLGACDDGGYYILGLKTWQARMFADIAWSTDVVAEQTRERARELGLEMIELEPWNDVDDAPSLRALMEEMKGDDRSSATAAVIDRLGLRQALRGASGAEPA